MYVFLCEDSPEGIFTGVYDAWESRLGHNNISLQIHRHRRNMIPGQIKADSRPSPIHNPVNPRFPASGIADVAYLLNQALLHEFLYIADDRRQR